MFQNVTAVGFVAALILSSGIAVGHTFSEDPTHVGDITDPAADTDQRPWGDGAVPPSLDVREAWIDASDADELVLHIQLEGIPIVPEADGWRYYTMWVETPGLSSFCGDVGDPAVMAVISPVGPNFPGNSWWLTCLDRTAEDQTAGYLTRNFVALDEGAWAAGPSGTEVQIVLPRELDVHGQTFVVPQGAQAVDLQVATWTWSTPLIEFDERGVADGTLWFYGPFPFADTTDVLEGPVQL